MRRARVRVLVLVQGGTAASTPTVAGRRQRRQVGDRAARHEGATRAVREARPIRQPAQRRVLGDEGLGVDARPDAVR